MTQPTNHSRRRRSVPMKRSLDFIKKAFHRKDHFLFSFFHSVFNTSHSADFDTFDVKDTKNLPPIDVNKDFPVFSQTFSCKGAPSFSANIKADAIVKAHAEIVLGVAAAGTLVPPKLTEFGLFAEITQAQIDGILDLKGTVAVWTFPFRNSPSNRLLILVLGHSGFGTAHSI